MNETEIALLNALECLESNRKQTETVMLNALQQLTEQVKSLEAENKLLSETQKTFANGLGILGRQLEKQSAGLQRQSEIIGQLIK